MTLAPSTSRHRPQPPRPQGGDLNLGSLDLAFNLTDFAASTSPTLALRCDLDLGDLDVTLDLTDLTTSTSTSVT
jgi:hypothetical protein